MDSSKYLLDLVLVPLSLFITASYHAYVWQNFEANFITIGANLRGKMAWLHDIIKDNDKKGLLGVQTMRNTLMSLILSASIAMTVNSSMAATANNAYNAGHLLRQHQVFGRQSESLLVLKYGWVSVLLLLSFTCSAMAVGCIIEANFLINASEFGEAHARMVMKRGLVLGIVGNRVLCLGLCFLLWLLGPVPLAFSSLAMVFSLYNLDFV